MNGLKNWNTKILFIYLHSELSNVCPIKKLKVMEDMLIRKIKGGIFAIKNNIKTPQEANIGKFLNRLKDINRPMYDELMNDYKAATIKK